MPKRRPFLLDRLLTSYEAAEYLQIDHRALRRMLQTGQIHGYRLPGENGKESKLWRVPMASIQAFLEEGEN